MSKKVFVLMHAHETSPDVEDIKLIGVYSSEVAAKSAAERTKYLPGFADTPEGFHVQAYQLDKDHWVEGFVTEPLGGAKMPPRRGVGKKKTRGK